MRQFVSIILVSFLSLSSQAQQGNKKQSQSTASNVQQKQIELKEISGMKLSFDNIKRNGIQDEKQSQKNEVVRFDYEEVIPVNLSKTELWLNVKKWISSNFSSYKHVVDVEDKDAGILVVKWNSDVENPYSRYWTAQYEATYQIDVRDNKYRIKIYNSSVLTKPNVSTRDINNMSTSSLTLAQEELETVVDICKSLQGKMTWNLDNHFLQVMESNSKYKPLMKAVKDSYMRFNNSVLNSLKISMTKTDNF